MFKACGRSFCGSLNGWPGAVCSTDLGQKKLCHLWAPAWPEVGWEVRENWPVKGKSKSFEINLTGRHWRDVFHCCSRSQFHEATKFICSSNSNAQSKIIPSGPSFLLRMLVDSGGPKRTAYLLWVIQSLMSRRACWQRWMTWKLPERSVTTGWWSAPSMKTK